MESFLLKLPDDLSSCVFSEFLTVKCLMFLDSCFCCTTERPEFLHLMSSRKCKVQAKVEKNSELKWVVLRRIRIEHLVLSEKMDFSLIANNCFDLIHLGNTLLWRVAVSAPRLYDIIARNPHLQIVDLNQTRLNAEFTDCLLHSTCHRTLRALRLCVDNTVTIQVIARIINTCPNLGACEIRQFGRRPVEFFGFGQEWGHGDFAFKSSQIGLPMHDSSIKMRLRMTRRAFNQTRGEFNEGLLGLIASMESKQVKEMWINSQGQLRLVLAEIATFIKGLTRINIECPTGLKVKKSDMTQMEQILMSCTHLKHDGIYIM